MHLQQFDVINPLLKPYIAFYYLLSTEEDDDPSVYTAYPSNNTPVCFFTDCEIQLSPRKAIVQKKQGEQFTEIVVGNCMENLQVHMGAGIKEFCITFKPLGFNYTQQGKAGDLLHNDFIATDGFRELEPVIVSIINGSGNIAALEEQLLSCIQFNAPLEKLQEVITIIEQDDGAFETIAARTFITTKNMYRLFHEHLGISPSQYRRIHKFRHAIGNGAKSRYKKGLASLALDSGYYDQPNLTREMKKITNLSPKNFLAAITHYANNKVLWKMD